MAVLHRENRKYVVFLFLLMQIFCFFLFKEIRDGEVDKNDLEELSTELGKSWEDLASGLKFDQAEIENFDLMNKELRKKSYRMLCAWKRKKASSATYTVLYKALCHKYVGRKDLAEKYCFRKSTGKEESTSEG